MQRKGKLIVKKNKKPHVQEKRKEKKNWIDMVPRLDGWKTNVKNRTGVLCLDP
jgi:hypothetical protein